MKDQKMSEPDLQDYRKRSPTTRTIMKPQDLLDVIRRTINDSQRLTISASAERPLIATLPCSLVGNSLLLDVPSSFPSSIIIKRPRVSFCTAPDPAGRAVHGNGIARITPSGDGRRITIVPYRLQLNDSATCAGTATIELRQNSWQCREAPVVSRGPRFWLRAMRSVSFPLSILPVCIGAGMAALHGAIDWFLFALALTGGVAAHAATNLVSDYHDFIKGADTTNALSSHTGVLVDELIEPSGILLAAMGCFTVSAFTGGILVALVGWPILLFGLAGMLGGYAYTGGPAAWKYIGLGECSTGFLMGPLMAVGAYFVQARSVSITVVLLSIAIGLLVSAVSFGNNLRDAFFDRAAGITTMPVKIGASAALAVLRLLLIAPYVLVVLAILLDHRLVPLSAAALTLPWAVGIFRAMGKAKTLADLSDQAARIVLPLKVILLHQRFGILVLIGCGFAVFFPFH
jgi:1,4-dihydroxy-2-naphthoate octaprenyltransferase